MRFIKRIPITEGMISGEQAQQTDLWYTREDGQLVGVLDWVNHKNVAIDERRSHDGKVWQALVAHAENTEPDKDPTRWAFVAPTNRWAAFDDAVGSYTRETGSLSFKLTPGAKFDSFGCLGMAGDVLEVDLEVPNTATLGGFVSRTLPSSQSWSSVTFGNGLFVAVAGTSAIAATSPDGITWTQRYLPSSQSWESVTFGGGLFVAVSGSSVAATSPDGTTWTQGTLPSSQSWRSVTFGNSLFVAVAYASSVAATATYDNSIYKTTIALIEDAEPVIDFWAYCFSGFKQKEDLIVTGLNSASYTNASITITLTGPTVKLGTFNFGMVQVLGVTEMGMKTGITNYSTYDVDQFGVTRIVPRSFSKKINANVMVDRENYNTVYQALVDYKDTAVIVFPSDSEDYSKANAYGHIREWSLSIDYPTYTMLPIEVRGLT